MAPFYQGYPYNQMYFSQLQNTQQPQQNNGQIQNGGFVMVKNEIEAMNYPVAPGNSVTFKNEGQPYIYVKTLGFSQLDQPIFEKYRLIKENPFPEVKVEEQTKPTVEYLSIGEADILKSELAAIKEEVNFLKAYIEDDKEASINVKHDEHTKQLNE